MHEVALHGMRFHALVGILPHEREVAQPIEIDLAVRVVPGEQVLDYRALYELAATVLRSGPIDYLEEVADAVARGALAHNDRIRSVRVAVRKPHVAMPGPVAYAQVTLELDADG